MSSTPERLEVAGVREVLGLEQMAGGRDEGHAATYTVVRRMKLIYTYTDEAPALATHSFLPIIEAFAGKAGVDVELRDISLAGRILAQFGHQPDALAELGELRQDARGEHHQAAEHLRVDPAAQGGDQGAPGRRLRPAGVRGRAGPYDQVKGSAVNPVLREGNPTAARRSP